LQKKQKTKTDKLMRSKSTTIDFNSQAIYVGIDVHLKSWRVTIMLNNREHKTFSQDPYAKVLSCYLRKHFPGGTYYSAYEAGFCGFSTHRELEDLGIHNIVVNPSDIPTTDKEKQQKEDKRDSRKIARSLKNGELTGIYIPGKEMEELRSLVRYRKTLVKEISRHKCRIKSYLYYNGIKIPFELEGSSRYWSGRFTEWLKTIELSTVPGTMVLEDTLETATHLRKKLLKINRHLRQISKEGEYVKRLNLLQSIPGIGQISSITLLSEMGTILRFKNFDRLCSFVGLVPSTNSSGEKENVGRITRRSNRFLRDILIESSCMASRLDPSLALCYGQLCKRMESNEAIIRIAKKLLNRIRYVMKNQTEYVYAVN
jgi:transposase